MGTTTRALYLFLPLPFFIIKLDPSYSLWLPLRHGGFRRGNWRRDQTPRRSLTLRPVMTAFAVLVPGEIFERDILRPIHVAAIALRSNTYDLPPWLT